MIMVSFLQTSLVSNVTSEALWIKDPWPKNSAPPIVLPASVGVLLQRLQERNGCKFYPKFGTSRLLRFAKDFFMNETNRLLILGGEPIPDNLRDKERTDLQQPRWNLLPLNHHHWLHM